MIEAIAPEGEYLPAHKTNHKNLRHLSKDPQNKKWATDKSKFGYKMLMKMGWTEGKGLGMNENGMTDYVKTKTITEKEGVGTTQETKEDWKANNNDFNQLLANLNAAYSCCAPTTEEKKEKDSTATPKHLIYHKRHKSKVVSNYSKSDLDEILGVKKQHITVEKETISQVYSQNYVIFAHF